MSVHLQVNQLQYRLRLELDIVLSQLILALLQSIPNITRFVLRVRTNTLYEVTQCFFEHINPTSTGEPCEKFTSKMFTGSPSRLEGAVARLT